MTEEIGSIGRLCTYKASRRTWLIVVLLVSWGNRRLRAKGFQFIAWDYNESCKMSLSVKRSACPDLFIVTVCQLHVTTYEQHVSTLMRAMLGGTTHLGILAQQGAYEAQRNFIVAHTLASKARYRTSPPYYILPSQLQPRRRCQVDPLATQSNLDITTSCHRIHCHSI